jgi:5-deoxy-glucuronate isomerase
MHRRLAARDIQRDADHKRNDVEDSAGGTRVKSVSQSTTNGVRLETVTLVTDQTKTISRSVQESVIVLLQGILSIDLANDSRTIERMNPFDHPAVGLYLPPGTQCLLRALDSTAELVIAYFPATRQGTPTWLHHDEREQRGRGSWLREVGSLLRPPLSEHLLVGETVARDGAWSTYPPHKHEATDLPNESSQQEIFYFRMRPQTGFGVLLNYTESVNDGVALILNNDSVATVNDGYHAIAVAGGYDLYYFWAAAGDDSELVFRADPAHEWLQS